MGRPGIKSWAAGSAALLASALPVGAQDRSQYTLFNPAPDRALRELSTDRPDTTESAFTVDAGRVQFETTLFGYSRSRPDADGAVSDTYEIGTTNIRIGLNNRTELGVVWQPYGSVRTRMTNPAGSVRESGIGGVDLRAKFNLWGNDTFEKPGATAFGLLPYVTLPTDRHNGISPEFVEGGLILPFAVKLTDKLELGLNAGVAYVRPDAGAGYNQEYIASASFSYEWNDKLGTYYEVAARLHTDDPRGDPVVLGTGFAYKLDKNTQLDAGINVGVTRAADRVNPFVGISRRF